jgi:PS-10 peptidase S37
MKKTAIIISLFIQTIFVFSQNEMTKIERMLYDMPDISFEKLTDGASLYPEYKIKIKQPLDHKNPKKGYFYQLMRLTHHGFDRPTVMSTQGYQIFLGKNEIEAILDANHLNIEHRFFGESVPDSMQWQYLTLEQVTADLHHINELFRAIYPNKWVSTGISKGGQTTIFYRYFYPNDVNVSIPYVAPFNNGLEDKRIYTFLDTIGTLECRQKIHDFQVYMLQNETEALKRLKWFSKGAKLKYDYLGSLEKAYEYTVLEYSFSFWQWGSTCSNIPDNSNLDVALEHLIEVSDIGFFSDRDIAAYAPHYYQAATQMGYYGYNIAPFKPYLTQFKQNPLATFPPKAAGLTVYDNLLNEKVDKWLNSNGNNFIYIYGGDDTWSADRVFPSNKVNSKSYILVGKDHGKARIKNMSPEMQQDLALKLKGWLDLPVDLEQLGKKK